MIEGLEKDDLEDTKKILDQIISKTEKARERMETIEKDAAELKKIVSQDSAGQEGEETGWQKLDYRFNRTYFIALISLIERFVYVNVHDGAEMGRNLSQLRELQNKLK